MNIRSTLRYLFLLWVVCLPLVGILTTAAIPSLAHGAPESVVSLIIAATIFLLLLVVSLATVRMYNRLVPIQNVVCEKYAAIEVQLQKRHDLIGRLLQIAGQYMGHEGSTFKDVAEARSVAANAQDIQSKASAEERLTAGVVRLLATAESHPDLKANQNFLACQNELAATEHAIANARDAFNKEIREYNSLVQAFPAFIFAGLCGCGAQRFFAARMETTSSSDVLQNGTVSAQVGKPSSVLPYVFVVLAFLAGAALVALVLLPRLGTRQVPEQYNSSPSPTAQTLETKLQAVDLGGGISLDLVWIPPGNFIMGSPEDEENRYGDEGPQHRVTLTKGFWMGKYEVTQAQWEQVMGDNPSYFTSWFKSTDNFPVECISWQDCQAFLGRLNGGNAGTFRLPTEAEWEYACRAMTTTAYYFGNDPSYLGDYAWYGDNSDKTQPVGRKRPNGWGLYDMHGNVSEWCADWYGDYGSEPVTDPVGPGSGSDRVLRGGSWDHSAHNCRSASRDFNAPDLRNYLIGFRVVRTP